MKIERIENIKRRKNLIKILKITHKKIVLVGKEKDVAKINRILLKKDNYWGIAKFDEDDLGKDYTQLAFEDVDSFIVVFCDGDKTRQHEEKLIEIGFNINQFIRYTSVGIGSKLDYYDYLIGYTKKSKNNLPGYDIFPQSESIEPKQGEYTILTLGGVNDGHFYRKCY